MTPETLRAYVVCLSFEPPGPVHAGTWLAPDAPSAAALATAHFMRQTSPAENLMACLVLEMPAEQLRHYLRAVEGRLPDSGNAEVLSLVPKPADPAEPDAETLKTWPRWALEAVSAGMPWQEAVAKVAAESEKEAFARTVLFGSAPDYMNQRAEVMKYWGRHGNLSGSPFVYDEPFGPPEPPEAA